MATTVPHDDGLGSGHDRTERERDVLRELHELTDRPRPGEQPPEVLGNAGTDEARAQPASGGSDRPHGGGKSDE
jgi:hypothetical protein